MSSNLQWQNMSNRKELVEHIAIPIRNHDILNEAIMELVIIIETINQLIMLEINNQSLDY